MNYRHAYHAGNFADVLKHAALVCVLLHLRKKESPFAVFDCHAGRGLYDLRAPEAEKTGEAKSGILKLLDGGELPGVLGAYAEIVRGFGSGVYPGSPLIVAKLLRRKDRLVAVEAQEAEHKALAAVLNEFPRARTVHGDGYRELKRFLPPPERRGLVLIDPPYEASDEFQQATHAVIEAHKRFATGIVLFWYPAKQAWSAEAAAGELINAGISSLARVELDIGAPPTPPPEGRGPPLTATGLLVVNPPFGFDTEMRAILPVLAERLAQGAGASGTFDSLATR